MKGNKMVDISGAWLWQDGNGNEMGLVFVITQIEDRFTWRMVNKNGHEQTGIGSIKCQCEGCETCTKLCEVEATWNWHDGKENAISKDTGMVEKDARCWGIRIVWSKGKWGEFHRSGTPE